jgi:hypothetical protein
VRDTCRLGEGGIELVYDSRLGTQAAYTNESLLRKARVGTGLACALYRSVRRLHRRSRSRQGAESYLGGTSKAEDALFVVGVVGLLIWLVGCFALLIAPAMSSARH